MSFITDKSFVFNGINSSDYNVVIGWVDSDITVSENGLNKQGLQQIYMVPKI